MLELTSSLLRRGPTLTAGTTRHRFAFENVAFEVLASEGVEWQLPSEYACQCLPISQAQVVADLLCSVRKGHPHNGSGPHAELTFLGPNRYAAAVFVAPGPQDLAALLVHLARAVQAAQASRTTEQTPDGVA